MFNIQKLEVGVALKYKRKGRTYFDSELFLCTEILMKQAIISIYCYKNVRMKDSFFFSI